jgi:hypothetical protein
MISVEVRVKRIGHLALGVGEALYDVSIYTEIILHRAVVRDNQLLGGFARIANDL